MLIKMAALVIAFLFLCSGALGQTTETWRSYTSDTGMFSMSTPCDPVADEEKVTAEGLSLINHYFGCNSSSGYFLATYTDVLAVTDPAATLDIFKSSVIKGFDGKLVSEKTILLGSIPGREFSAAFKSKDIDYTALCRIFLNGKRLYSLCLGTSTAKFDSPIASKFVTSFALIK